MSDSKSNGSEFVFRSSEEELKHHVNNALAIILGHSERRLKNTSSNEEKELLEMIIQQGQRINKVVNKVG